MKASLRLLLPVAVTVLVALWTFSAAAEETLKFSVYPSRNSSELAKRFLPFTKHLSEQLGRPVTFEIDASYDSHVDRIGSGTVDLAFMGGAAYVKLTEKYGRRPILGSFLTDKGKFYHGYILVRQDSPITTLSQLKGKHFAFGDQVSTMGHFVPRHMLLKAGIDTRQLSQVSYVPDHENITLGVLAGTFDAGAVRDDVFVKYESRGLRALAKSEPIIEHVFITRDTLPDETVQALRKACLGLSASEVGKSVLAAIRSDLAALVPCHDSDFDTLRTMVNELKEAGIEP